MNHRTSTEPRPWWADVAHLREDAENAAPTEAVQLPADTPVRRDEFDRAAGARYRSRPATSPRARRSGGEAPDWFVREAHVAGRRTRPERTSTRPSRPRATLVDDLPGHALLHRPIAVRRAPGERPTVTITGRPDAALPPRVAPPATIRGRRTREQATALVASPDRLILWAVALGILMILASIGTASV